MGSQRDVYSIGIGHENASMLYDEELRPLSLSYSYNYWYNYKYKYQENKICDSEVNVTRKSSKTHPDNSMLPVVKGLKSKVLMLFNSVV